MKSLLMLVGGIVIGGSVSWMYHKNKYEKMVQEEIESLRDHSKEKNKEDQSITKDEHEKKHDDEIIDEDSYTEDIDQVEKIIDYNHYSNPNDDQNIVNKYKKPYVVTPEEFATISGFDTDTFYYHHDNIISNGNNEMVEDVNDILGLNVDEIRDQFGVYEEDSVFIRNMRLKTDYEILLEESDYVKRNGD